MIIDVFTICIHPHTWLDALHLSKLYASRLYQAMSSHMMWASEKIRIKRSWIGGILPLLLWTSQSADGGLGLMRKSKLGLLHVNATCEKVGGDQNTGRTRAEFSHDKITLLTLPKHTSHYISKVWTHVKLRAQTAQISTNYRDSYSEHSDDFCTCWNQTPPSTRHKSFWSRSACMPWNMRIKLRNHVFPSFSWLPSKWKRLTAATMSLCNVADMSWVFVWHCVSCISMQTDACRRTSMHIVTSSGSEMFWDAAAWQDTVKSRFVSWSCKKSTLRRVLPWRPSGCESLPRWNTKNDSKHKPFQNWCLFIIVYIHGSLRVPPGQRPLE